MTTTVDEAQLWKQACDVFFATSGVDQNSQDWKAITNAKDLTDVLKIVEPIWSNYIRSGNSP